MMARGAIMRRRPAFEVTLPPFHAKRAAAVRRCQKTAVIPGKLRSGTGSLQKITPIAPDRRKGVYIL